MPCFASSSMSACPLFTLVRVLRIACLPLTLSNVTDNSILLPAFFFPSSPFQPQRLLHFSFILHFCTFTSLLFTSLLSFSAILIIHLLTQTHTHSLCQLSNGSFGGGGNGRGSFSFTTTTTNTARATTALPTTTAWQSHWIELKKSNKELLTLANSKTAAAGCKPN